MRVYDQSWLAAQTALRVSDHIQHRCIGNSSEIIYSVVLHLVLLLHYTISLLNVIHVYYWEFILHNSHGLTKLWSMHYFVTLENQVLNIS